METIRRDRIFYDESSGGVTFSGGEPLLQIDFLYRLLKECAREEIHRVVDTSGFVDQTQLSEIAAETDLFLYDLKLMDPNFHKLHTGVDNRLILDNLRWLCREGFQVIVRIPVIPGINDQESNLEELAKFLLSLPNTPPVQLLLFHSLAKNKHERFGLPYRLDPNLKRDPEKLELIAQRLIRYGLNASAGEYNEPENSASQTMEL
jgi:pyruvate formate lyase activating enzyme